MFRTLEREKVGLVLGLGSVLATSPVSYNNTVLYSCNELNVCKQSVLVRIVEPRLFFG